MLPVLSKMRNPKEFKKPLYISMSIVTASYLSLSMVIFVYCGKWIASPSLGSAGPRFNKAAYGIALVSLFITACIWIHVAAKYCFVRLLRGTKHLQQNSATHFATWFGCTFGLSAIAFVIAAGIPIFNYILSLAGALGFAPLTIVLPASLWIYENKEYRRGDFETEDMVLRPLRNVWAWCFCLRRWRIRPSRYYHQGISGRHYRFCILVRRQQRDCMNMDHITIEIYEERSEELEEIIVRSLTKVDSNS